VGPVGPVGPPGPVGENTECFCIQQMQNVLSQLINLYPTNTVSITTESGSTTSGRLSALITNQNDGLLEIRNAAGSLVSRVSVCRIVALSIPGVTYQQNIVFNQPPEELPDDCGANCESSIRQTYTVGSTVSISGGGQVVANGTVVADEYGMIVTTNPANGNPEFVNTCKAEVFR
jgi:hypothetical protein